MSNTHRLTVAETERLQRGLETLAGMLDTHYGLRQRTDLSSTTLAAEQCYYNGLLATLEAGCTIQLTFHQTYFTTGNFITSL